MTSVQALLAFSYRSTSSIMCQQLRPQTTYQGKSHNNVHVYSSDHGKSHNNVHLYDKIWPLPIPVAILLLSLLPTSCYLNRGYTVWFHLLSIIYLLSQSTFIRKLLKFIILSRFTMYSFPNPVRQLHIQTTDYLKVYWMTNPSDIDQLIVLQVYHMSVSWHHLSTHQHHDHY